MGIVSEPKYDGDTVNLGYLNKALENIDIPTGDIPQAGIDYSKNFGAQPTPPYHINDTWTSGIKTYVCIVERLIGEYNASDWIRADNNTDDSALNTFLTGDYAELLSGVAANLIEAKEYADAKKTEAIAAAELVSIAKADLAQANAIANADGKITAEEEARILEASTNLATAQSYAETKASEAQSAAQIYAEAQATAALSSAKSYADTKKIEADTAAQAYADAQLALEVTRANAYADGVASDAELAAIAAAEAQVTDARTYSETKAGEAELAAKTYADTQLGVFVNGQFTDLLNATDSIVVLHYKYDDPETDWDTYTKKDIHVGDLWRNKSVTPSVTYRYTKTEGTPPTYSWEVADVPVDMFDELDGKKSIYSTQPSQYQKNDMWVIPTGLSDIPSTLHVGDWVMAINDNTTFDWNDWSKRDNYIQKSVVDDALIPVTTQIDDITNDLDLNTPSSKLSKIVQTLTDLSTSFEIKGGSNLIPDSVLILESSNSVSFTKTGTWDVVQNQDIANNTVSKFMANCIAAGKLKWIINVIPSTAFTLSLVYNNTNSETSTLKLKNGTQSTLINETSDKLFQKFECGFVSNSNVIEIEIETNGTHFGYSDLMLNYGAIVEDGVIRANALRWQPAPGENIGNNIRLSYEGARFTMLGGVLYHIIDNTGDRILRVADNSIVTDFDANGINTDNVTSKKSVNVGNFTMLAIDEENCIEF